MKIARKLWGCIAFMAVGIMLLPSASYAHTYRSDGPVQVLMHVDPNDTPITHEPSNLNFYVFDSQKKFLGSQCDCNVKVTLGGKVVLSRPIIFDDNNFSHVARVPIVFPSIGIYQIYLTGKPRGSYVFHAFNLNYIQRVSIMGPADTTWSRSSIILYVAIGVLVVAGLATTVWTFKPKKRT